MRQIRILVITLPFPDLIIHETVIKMLQDDGYQVLSANHIEAIDISLSTFHPDLIIFPAGTTRSFVTYRGIMARSRILVLFASRSHLNNSTMARRSPHNIMVINSKGSIEVILQYVWIMLDDIQQDVDWLNQIYRQNEA